MGPSATHESGHFYFAQTGHSHFAATRWVGRLDTTLIFCYIVPVEKCVQKAGDPSRFFYFRPLLIAFAGYVGTQHRRPPTATHIKPQNFHPPRPDQPDSDPPPSPAPAPHHPPLPVLTRH